MRARSFLIVAWLGMALLLLLSFWVDLVNVAQGGAIDLRNRITGARLLTSHLDPYFYKWHEPEPAQFCDVYNNPQLPVSKTTATPVFLLLSLPLAEMPYRLGQFLWFFTQWILLLATGWQWLRRLPAGWPRLLLAAFVTGFTYTAAWRLHAERGQSYVLLLFLFALWLARTRRIETRSGFLSGLLAGVLVILRPPFLLLVPFLALHRRGQLPGAVVGLLLGLLLPMFWRGDCWTKYLAAMQTHSELYLHGIDPAPGPTHFPPTIEGVPTDLLANYVTIPYADSSVHAALRTAGLEPFSSWALLLVFTALYGLWLWYSRNQATERLLLGLAAWLFLVDFFLPAYRNNYNDVLIINVVALGLVTFPKTFWQFWPCCLALPIGWAVDAFAPMHDGLINFPTLLYVAGAVLLLFTNQTIPRQRCGTTHQG